MHICATFNCTGSVVRLNWESFELEYYSMKKYSRQDSAPRQAGVTRFSVRDLAAQTDSSAAPLNAFIAALPKDLIRQVRCAT